MVKIMKIYKSFDINKNHKYSIILIGNFDGIHLGHQKLFSLAKKYKKKYSLKIGVLTFEPMPKMFFNKKITNFRISSLKQKIDLLNNHKVDFVITKQFNKSFSKTSSLNFIKEILGKKLKPKFVFVSNNFRFGKNREGNVKQLKKFETLYSYKMIKPQPLLINNKMASSSLIRNLLQNGKLEKANKLLNRKWSIYGKVQKGKQLGKKIGFPTANIDIKDYVLASPGVYAIKVKTSDKGRYFKGIANLGYRPTFKGKNLLLEVNIFGLKANLYNKKIYINFVKFIRPEKKFDSINRLKAQIKKDIIKVKK